jgi:hypothetical protein
MSTTYRGDAFSIVRGASGFRGSPSERLVFVFQCYLDDSGTSGLPIVTMAGFVAVMSQWEVLEQRLDEAMSRYEVPVLHTKEFHATRGFFKDWKRIKKRSFAEELFSSAHGRLLGLSATVRKEAFFKARKEMYLPSNMSPIGVCFSMIMTRIVTDPQLLQAIQKDGIAFLVETGNNNNSEIGSFFHQMAKEKTFEGCLRSITFIPKGHCRAIQIADFLAFYSRRHMRDQDRFDGKIALPLCPYLQIIKQHGPLWMEGMRSQSRGIAGRLKDFPTLSSLSDMAKEGRG